ncbi:helix-turn-helix domain-containing protein [Xylophilus sp. Kf1]|nr:helix-turn-helix domain-containing protein [Xylophilus sp. Kf1]
MPIQSPKYAHEPSLIALGKAIRELRVMQRVSQEDLAHRASLDRSYMSSIERGVQNPGVMIVIKIASALGVPASAVFLQAGL